MCLKNVIRMYHGPLDLDLYVCMYPWFWASHQGFDVPCYSKEAVQCQSVVVPWPWLVFDQRDVPRMVLYGLLLILRGVQMPFCGVTHRHRHHRHQHRQVGRQVAYGEGEGSGRGGAASVKLATKRAARVCFCHWLSKRNTLHTPLSCLLHVSWEREHGRKERRRLLVDVFTPRERGCLFFVEVMFVVSSLSFVIRFAAPPPPPPLLLSSSFSLPCPSCPPACLLFVRCLSVFQEESRPASSGG